MAKTQNSQKNAKKQPLKTPAQKKAEKRDLPVTIWTADNPRWIKRAFDLGLFAVITNNPATLLAKRAEISKKF